MVVVLDRHEAEGLQDAVSQVAHGTENLRHAVDWTRLRLERDFDEVSLSERLCQTEQASGHGNGLEFGFRAAAIF